MGPGKSLCYPVLTAVVTVKSSLHIALQQVFEADNAALFLAHSHGCLHVWTYHTEGHTQNDVNT